MNMPWPSSLILSSVEPFASAASFVEIGRGVYRLHGYLLTDRCLGSVHCSRNICISPWRCRAISFLHENFGRNEFAGSIVNL
jgi:hypothetical protein